MLLQVAALGDRFPFGRDGLDLFFVMRDFAHAYVTVYYQNDAALRRDTRLQRFWQSARVFGESSGTDWSAFARRV